jgi:hypothetical protein
VYTPPPFRGSKPPAGRKPLWGHPLTAGLVAAYCFNDNGGNTMTDAAGTRNFISTVMSWGGNTYLGSYRPGWSSSIFINITTGSVYGGGGFPLTATSWAFSFWAQFSSGAFNRLISFGSGGPTIQATTGNALRFVHGGTVDWTPGVTVSTDWNHIAATRVNNDIFFYINGLQVATTTYSIANTFTGLSFGYDFAVGEPMPNGGGDALFVWNRFLTQNEVWQLYQEPFAMFGSAGVEQADVSSSISSVSFRRTLSSIGGRAGSRQLQAA